MLFALITRLALFLNKDNKTAADQFRPVLASNSRDGEAYFLLAKALELQGDAEKAAEFDNQARRFLMPEINMPNCRTNG